MLLCMCAERDREREREMNVWLMWQCDFLIFFTGIMDSCFVFSAVSPRGRCFHSRLGCHIVLLVFTTVNSKENYHIIKINSFHFHTMLFVFMLYKNKAFLLYVKSIAKKILITKVVMTNMYLLLGERIIENARKYIALGQFYWLSL